MLRVKAPAKINLALHTKYKRDDGYHAVEMIMTMLDFSDYLTLSLNESRKSGITLSANIDFFQLGPKNLVYQAADLFLKYFNIKASVHIHIEKNIPISAGLAGGSTNAAATLKGMRDLLSVDCSDEELIYLGTQIGSDVPFCITGGTALATGRGELLKPLPAPPLCSVILVNPKISVSTKDIYAAFSPDTAQTVDVEAMQSAILSQDFNAICQHLGNNLEPIASQKEPVITEIKQQLLDLGVNGALMSGSGSTVFGLVYTEKKAKQIYEQLKNIYPKYIVKLTRLLT